MRVVFIEPKPPFNLYYFLGQLPLLGNLYMGTILKEAGHEVHVLKENLHAAYYDRRDRLDPLVQQADVVGITATTHTVKRAYRIADAIKRRQPYTRVIMGGSHASALPEEALEHADQVVAGEGDPVIRDIVEGRKTDRVVTGMPPDLDTLPALDLSLLAGGPRGNGSKRLSIAPIMASRGCPYDCVFCSVTRMFGRRYRVRAPELVLEEVRRRYREGFRQAFFYDDNFAANRRKTKQFLRMLIDEDLDFRWSSQFSMQAADDPELLELLRRAKCHTLFIGLESVNPQTLRDYRKHQTVKSIAEGMKQIRAAGLKVHGMFVLGGDTDTEETVNHTVDFARRIRCHTAQFSVLFPIPGTQLYQDMQRRRRIFVDDWEAYDGSHVVILPERIRPFRLQKQILRAYKRFFNTSWQRWVASRLGILLWWFTNQKYWRFLKHFDRSGRYDKVKAEAKRIAKQSTQSEASPAQGDTGETATGTATAS